MRSDRRSEARGSRETLILIKADEPWSSSNDIGATTVLTRALIISLSLATLALSLPSTVAAVDCSSSRTKQCKATTARQHWKRPRKTIVEEMSQETRQKMQEAAERRQRDLQEMSRIQRETERAQRRAIEKMRP